MEHSRVEQPLILLLLGCEANSDAIVDMELPATTKCKKKLNFLWAPMLCLPVGSDMSASEAGRHVVDFLDSVIDVFLEVQDKRYSSMLYLTDYIA